MIILPAIDLQNGCCVRLRQGIATDSTTYSSDPLAQARSWLEQGARQLHVVDLDGAFAGEPRHTAVITQIVRALNIPVEVGGGLRSDEHVQQLLEAGVQRVILGTRALQNPEQLAALVQRHGAKHIAVGIDARDGLVQIKGWVETTQTQATALAQQVAACGVGTIIYTDTATDGMLGGPNLKALAQICLTAPQVNIIASGGVSAPEHVTQLRALGYANLYGAIAGKALYDNRTTLAELNRASEI